MTCIAAEHIVGRPNATIAQALHRLSLLDSVPRRRGRPSKSEVEQRSRLDRLRSELCEEMHQLRVKHDSLTRVEPPAQSMKAATKRPPIANVTGVLGAESTGSTNQAGIQSTTNNDSNSASKQACTILKGNGETKEGAMSGHAVPCKRKQAMKTGSTPDTMKTYNVSSSSGQSDVNETTAGAKKKKKMSTGGGDECGRGVKRNADSTDVEQSGRSCKSPKQTDDEEKMLNRNAGEILEARGGDSDNNNECREKDGETGRDEKQAVIESLQREISEVREQLQRESKRADELEEALNVEVQVHASNTAQEEMLKEKVKALEKEVERYERKVTEGEDEIREKRAALKELMAQVKELESRRCEGCGGCRSKTWREDDSVGGEDTTQCQVDGLKEYVETLNARLKRVLQRNRRMQQRLYELAGRHGSFGVGEVT